MSESFEELDSVLDLKNFKSPLLKFDFLDFVKTPQREYPIVGISIGQHQRPVPTLGVFGGVHGLERIGTHVVLSFLRGILTRLAWDEELQKSFENFRIVSIPLVNPAGMHNNMRSNYNGIDLMRNAPVDSIASPLNIVSGHRLGNWLPWYRGASNSEMEVESKVLIKYVQENVLNAPVSMAIDIHSGFGSKDRLWYPFSKDRSDFPFLRQVHSIKQLLDTTYPHHIYTIEPQHLSYMISGDLWDYLFLEHYKTERPGQIFIPWTLEIGSWIWIKKNPSQLFSALGIFNPIKEHRYARTMRRHLLLLNFLCQAIKNQRAWS
jgi:hypothetical protein